MTICFFQTKVFCDFSNTRKESGKNFSKRMFKVSCYRQIQKEQKIYYFLSIIHTGPMKISNVTWDLKTTFYRFFLLPVKLEA